MVTSWTFLFWKKLGKMLITNSSDENGQLNINDSESLELNKLGYFS